MTPFAFWHPVLLESELPVGRVAAVKLLGESLAVFRDCRGGLGALRDECAHRRMRLSAGRIEGERLVCPYHGWSYGADGKATCPTSPRLQACIPSFAAAAHRGLIWVCAQGHDTAPSIEVPEGVFAGAFRHHVPAPIELVIDNFSEVEHTIAVHPDFGFDGKRGTLASVDIRTTPETVTVLNRGPSKRLPLQARVAIGLRRGDYFHSDFTFHFDPPRSHVAHRWSDGRTGAERRLAYNLVHYFVPEDRTATNIVTFAFVTLRYCFARALRRPIATLFARKLNKTIEEDTRLLANLADQSTELAGMRLGRFDAVLQHTRDRLRRVYGY